MINVWNYIKDLLDVSDIVSDVVKALGGLVLSAMAALIWILLNNRSKSFYKFLYKSIFNINNIRNNKSDFCEKYKKFKNYIPHNVTDSKNNIVLSFKDFFKAVKKSNAKCVLSLVLPE